MTITPQPPVQASRPAPDEALDTEPEGSGRRLSRAAKVILFVLLPLTVVAVVGGLIAALWPAPVQLDFRETGASRLSVDVPDARIDLVPSGDGEVHVEVTGWYSGREPDFTVRTADDETVVRGACRVLWLSRCSLTVSIALPEDAEVAVAGTNGNIAVTRLSGPLDIGTTNGALDLRDVTGPLSLRTTNGAIAVHGTESSRVLATTTNGQVELDFTVAPTEVLARSTNGGVTVRVPGGESYFVDARTTNGRVDTGQLVSDRDAGRRITAETTNGDISVEGSDR